MLINSSGQNVFKEKIHVFEGYNSFDYLNGLNLKKGTYCIYLLFQDQKYIYKIIKS